MKSKFKETRLWSVEAVRDYCINYGLYSCGDVTAYNDLLNYVSDHNPTIEAIEYVAADIIRHSKCENTIAFVMYQIQRECVSIIFEECNDWPINGYQE